MLLEREGEVTAAEAVQRLCGMQAQEPKHPFIGLWTRLEAFQREDLHAALHNREVVRGTLMRGTLHLAGPEQYAAMRPALQPVLSKGMRALGDRADGLDLEKVLPAARKLLVEYPRTFTELRAALQEQFPKVNERALGFAVRMHLPLLMVPTDSRWAYPQDAHFSLADDWLGKPVGESEDP
ncbi:MAG: winged helix DNA-binding domain-containing protein, partial [Thermoleophilaceae bacterium]|nr:winged helix DNA-binding domain-containing protein [Thermoleophilaceae bacterium]